MTKKVFILLCGSDHTSFFAAKTFNGLALAALANGLNEKQVIFATEVKFPFPISAEAERKKVMSLDFEGFAQRVDGQFKKEGGKKTHIASGIAMQMMQYYYEGLGVKHFALEGRNPHASGTSFDDVIARESKRIAEMTKTVGDIINKEVTDDGALIICNIGPAHVPSLAIALKENFKKSSEELQVLVSPHIFLDRKSIKVGEEEATFREGLESFSAATSKDEAEFALRCEQFKAIVWDSIFFDPKEKIIINDNLTLPITMDEAVTFIGKSKIKDGPSSSSVEPASVVGLMPEIATQRK